MQLALARDDEAPNATREALPQCGAVDVGVFKDKQPVVVGRQLATDTEEGFTLFVCAAASLHDLWQVRLEEPDKLGPQHCVRAGDQPLLVVHARAVGDAWVPDNFRRHNVLAHPWAAVDEHTGTLASQQQAIDGVLDLLLPADQPAPFDAGHGDRRTSMLKVLVALERAMPCIRRRAARHSDHRGVVGLSRRLGAGSVLAAMPSSWNRM